MSDQVIQLVAHALWTATLLAAPVLGSTLAVGLLLSVLQSATQIQESTLTFVPKLLVAALVMVFTGAWTLRVLQGFVREAFAALPALLAS